MSKIAKKWLLAAASLVVIGAAVFAAVMTVYDWDFTRLSTDRIETNTYEIKEAFDSIKVNTVTADILFAASDDGICRVVCREQENMKHSVDVRDDTLVVDVEDDRKWYDYIGIHLQSSEITIYLPEVEYASLDIQSSTGAVGIPGDLKFDSADVSLTTGDVHFSASVTGNVWIHTTTGSVRVDQMSADTLELSVSTGEIVVSDVTCRVLISDGSTGDLSLKNVIASGRFSLERSTGDIIFDSSDAGEIFAKTSTGDVSGTFLSEKIFVTDTSTGDISVPGTTAGGKCEIITSTGDIRIGTAE